MRYAFDNDLHIHSKISLCSGVPEQTAERMLQYAKDNGLKTICVTDHHWDEDVPGATDWYEEQNYAWISQIKPLPTAEGIRFLFGCETELDKHMTLALTREHFDRFDFVIIPTTHMHMKGLTFDVEQDNPADKAVLWVKRLEAVLNMDLPFEKIGLAHLTCGLIMKSSRSEYLQVLEMISDEDMERLFTKAAKLGVGIEINCSDMQFADEEADIVLRPYRIAKKCGCKFYMGSDAHDPGYFDIAKQVFERAIDYLGLEESDKFVLK